MYIRASSARHTEGTQLRLPTDQLLRSGQKDQRLDPASISVLDPAHHSKTQDRDLAHNSHLVQVPGQPVRRGGMERQRGEALLPASLKTNGQTVVS